MEREVNGKLSLFGGELGPTNFLTALLHYTLIHAHRWVCEVLRFLSVKSPDLPMYSPGQPIAAVLFSHPMSQLSCMGSLDHACN